MSLGDITVQAYDSPRLAAEVGNNGNGLGLNALRTVDLSYSGQSWTMRFTCGA